MLALLEQAQLVAAYPEPLEATADQHLDAWLQERIRERYGDITYCIAESLFEGGRYIWGDHTDFNFYSVLNVVVAETDRLYTAGQQLDPLPAAYKDSTVIEVTPDIPWNDPDILPDRIEGLLTHQQMVTYLLSYTLNSLKDLNTKLDLVGVLEDTIDFTEIGPGFLNINDAQIFAGELASLIHDIGKLSGEYYKNTTWNQQIAQIIKQHPKLGVELLEAMEAKFGKPINPELLAEVKHSVYMHHATNPTIFEKIDPLSRTKYLEPKSYPESLTREEIEACSIVDYFMGFCDITAAAMADTLERKSGAIQTRARNTGALPDSTTTPIDKTFKTVISELEACLENPNSDKFTTKALAKYRAALAIYKYSLRQFSLQAKDPGFLRNSLTEFFDHLDNLNGIHKAEFTQPVPIIKNSLIHRLIVAEGSGLANIAACFNLN